MLDSKVHMIRPSIDQLNTDATLGRLDVWVAREVALMFDRDQPAVHADTRTNGGPLDVAVDSTKPLAQPTVLPPVTPAGQTSEAIPDKGKGREGSDSQNIDPLDGFDAAKEWDSISSVEIDENELWSDPFPYGLSHPQAPRSKWSPNDDKVAVWLRGRLPDTLRPAEFEKVSAEDEGEIIEGVDEAVDQGVDEVVAGGIEEQKEEEEGEDEDVTYLAPNGYRTNVTTEDTDMPTAVFAFGKTTKQGPREYDTRTAEYLLNEEQWTHGYLQPGGHQVAPIMEMPEVPYLKYSRETLGFGKACKSRHAILRFGPDDGMVTREMKVGITVLFALCEGNPSAQSRLLRGEAPRVRTFECYSADRLQQLFEAIIYNGSILDLAPIVTELFELSDALISLGSLDLGLRVRNLPNRRIVDEVAKDFLQYERFWPKDWPIQSLAQCRIGRFDDRVHPLTVLRSVDWSQSTWGSALREAIEKTSADPMVMGAEGVKGLADWEGWTGMLPPLWWKWVGIRWLVKVQEVQKTSLAIINRPDPEVDALPDD